MNYGTYIRLRREARGLSLQDVAKMIGHKGIGLLRDIERGQIRPRVQLQSELAEAIGFSIEILDALFDGCTPRMCRRCGCTNYDACVNEIGETCHWVEHDLCSACAGPATTYRVAA